MYHSKCDFEFFDKQLTEFKHKELTHEESEGYRKYKKVVQMTNCDMR